MVSKATSGVDIDLDYHKKLDQETRSMTSWPDPVLILESTFIDAVLQGIEGVFYVHLKSDDKIRNETLGNTDEKRAEIEPDKSERASVSVIKTMKKLCRLLYPHANHIEPDLEFDTSDGNVEDYVLQIWSKFTGEDLSHLNVGGSTAMDKKQTKGLKPGASAGEVAIYNALRKPFRRIYH